MQTTPDNIEYTQALFWDTGKLYRGIDFLYLGTASDENHMLCTSRDVCHILADTGPSPIFWKMGEIVKTS
jgi:hypothetical protein